MDTKRFQREDETTWRIEARGAMRVPAIIYASEDLLRDMDEKVLEQACNVAALPGIVGASYAMPDAHWGYGFPIGGVAAFDPDEGGVVSAGGVGFDISCGVRTLHTGLVRDEVLRVRERLAEELFRAIPAGVGRGGSIRLKDVELEAMLEGGAQWAVARGWGVPADLARIEDQGRVEGALPARVSHRAKERQRDQMGSLGSGNHYLELQEVTAIYDETVGRTYGLALGEVVLSIHCGSRGLGHQIGTDYLKEMTLAAKSHGIPLPERELACAPLSSEVAEAYLGAMRAGINCALANRQILTHLARQAFQRVAPQADLRLLYDVSHNTCKREEHVVAGRMRRVYVHRKGATRALGPGSVEIPEDLRAGGQPVLIGGSMGTASYILAGTNSSEERAFSSSCHGAGRALSRHAALKRWQGREVVQTLARRGILVRSPSFRGVAEEAPGAYKDVDAVVDAADAAGLSRKIARLEPLACVKG